MLNARPALKCASWVPWPKHRSAIYSVRRINHPPPELGVDAPTSDIYAVHKNWNCLQFPTISSPSFFFFFLFCNYFAFTLFFFFFFIGSVCVISPLFFSSSLNSGTIWSKKKKKKDKQTNKKKKKIRIDTLYLVLLVSCSLCSFSTLAADWTRKERRRHAAINRATTNKQTKKRKEKSVFITTATTKVFGKAETGIGKIQQGKKKWKVDWVSGSFLPVQ